jgi:hypothetical protein
MLKRIELTKDNWVRGETEDDGAIATLGKAAFIHSSILSQDLLY